MSLTTVNIPKLLLVKSYLEEALYRSKKLCLVLYIIAKTTSASGDLSRSFFFFFNSKSASEEKNFSEPRFLASAFVSNELNMREREEAQRMLLVF